MTSLSVRQKDWNYELHNNKKVEIKYYDGKWEMMKES
jgi:hypothetical protein